MSEPLIRVSGLKKYFNTPSGFLHAVEDVSFSLDPQKTLGVVGESGCGKSTLGRAILRLQEPTAGEVWFEGENILSYDAARLKQLRCRMQTDAGILRRTENLRSALKAVEDTRNRCLASRLVMRREWETADMYDTAGLILHAAAENHHSVGSHFITDENYENGGWDIE